MTRSLRLLLLMLAGAFLLVQCGGDSDAPTDGSPSPAGTEPTSVASAVPSPTSEPTQVDSTATSVSAEPPTSEAMLITSSEFVDGEPIPTLFSCDGENVSPQLAWQFAPADTVAYALVLQDPDAPNGTFIHWVVANIPAGTTELPQDWSPDAASGVVFGRTSAGGEGYLGPCPPPSNDAHRYEFRLFALDAAVDFDAGGSLTALEAAMNGHILAETLLTGTYDR